MSCCVSVSRRRKASCIVTSRNVAEDTVSQHPFDPRSWCVRDYRRTMPYLVFIGCCLIWGSTFLAIRIGNEAVPPVCAATLRLTLAAPLLVALVFATRQRFPLGPALRGAL